MFIELAAYMGAVLSMKADMLANENFLVTAKQKIRSVKEVIKFNWSKSESSIEAQRLKLN
jgi:hypothetical protein